MRIDSLISGVAAFRVCSGCSRFWADLRSFLEDPEVAFQGYQPIPSPTEVGLFLFNHALCGTTLSLRADDLAELIEVEKGQNRPECSLTELVRPNPPDCPNEFVSRIGRVLGVPNGTPILK